MLTSKYYLKCISLVTASVGVMGLISVTAVACSAKKTPSPVNTGVYNQWATDLAQSNDPFDVQTLSWYRDNTSSLFVGKNGENIGSQGTIWNYPSPSSDTFGHYFATNIHVVAEALIPATNHTYTLNSNYNFFNSRNAQEYFELMNVSLYSLSTQARPNGLNGGQWTGDWYNDFVIFRSSTPIFPYANTVNFMDTLGEYNWLANNVTIPNFYSCGWPALNDANWPASSKWVNVKYSWDPAKGQSSFSPSYGTAADYSRGYLDSSNTEGLVIGSKTNNRLAKSYARQIMLPELNTEGGSSGSLVSVNYEGNLMLVGIYWGGYTFDINSKTEFLGGVDLFYTSSAYPYGSYGTAPAYNDLK